MTKLICALLAILVGVPMFFWSESAGIVSGYVTYQCAHLLLAPFSLRKAVIRLIAVSENEILAATKNIVNQLADSNECFDFEAGKFHLVSLSSARKSSATFQLVFRCYSIQKEPSAIAVFDLGTISINGAPRWHRQSSDSEGCYFTDNVELKYFNSDGFWVDLHIENGVFARSSVTTLLEDAKLNRVFNHWGNVHWA